MHCCQGRKVRYPERRTIVNGKPATVYSVYYAHEANCLSLKMWDVPEVLPTDENYGRLLRNKWS